MERFEREVQLVVFKLDEEEYGVDILQVKEIIKLLDITRVPKAPWFVEGVINLRGSVIPVINLRKRFNINHLNSGGKDCRIIVVMIEDITVGVIVDSVNEVLRLNGIDIEPPPEMTGNIESSYLKGIGKIAERLITLLDLEQLIKA